MSLEETFNSTETAYDEFGFLERYAAYEGLPWRGLPPVRREFVSVGRGRLSRLSWGTDFPELILLHGAGQNAHTWDSVAMALDRSLMAIDLPGHGHSDWRDDKDYRPAANAAGIAGWLDRLPPKPLALVGMSLGGLTAITLAASRAYLVSCLVVIEATPGMLSRRTETARREQGGVTGLIAGQRTFASFSEMLHATAARAPGRPVSSLLPGVRHNARQFPDGRWGWRYDAAGFVPPAPISRDESLAETLWDDLSRIEVPIMLVTGANSNAATDEHLAEFLRRQPQTRVEAVGDAGHSVQSDRAVHLAGLIDDFTSGICRE